MRAALRVLLTLPLLCVAAWGALALYYAGPQPGWLATALAGVYAAGSLGALVGFRSFRRALLVFAALFGALLTWWTAIPPSNQRDWAPEVARTPRIELHRDLLTVHDLRSFDYRTETDFTPRYEERTYDLSKLTGVDLFLSYWGSPWIAHTIMSWEFEDAPPLAISIETRKDKTQQYSAIQGFFKQYELFYVVADERDLVRLRSNYRGEQVYLYHLDVPVAQARALLLDYVARINALADQPAFYDAATQNCTTTIRMHARHVNPDGLPFDWRLLLNGHIDEMLYERGRLDRSLPFAELRARSLIDTRAQAADQDPGFSRRIREGLPRPARLAGQQARLSPRAAPRPRGEPSRRQEREAELGRVRA